VKVNGKVNPTTILNVFDKYGKHGEVSSLRFDGEVMEQIPYSFYGDNPYNPYEVPCLPIPIPYHFFRGPEQQLYGRNPYPMPMPPPLLGTMPPPPRPPPPQQHQQQHPPPPPLPQHQQQQQPSPVSKAPSAPPAPLSPDPKCCTIMWKGRVGLNFVLGFPHLANWVLFFSSICFLKLSLFETKLNGLVV